MTVKELNKEQSEIVQRHSEYMKSEVGYALALEECTDILLDFHSEMKQANDVTTGEKQCNFPVVINWVACSERLPEGAMGSYLACLENNTVHKLQYSDITKHWWDIALGDIRPNNPVKYWAELPEPPCL